MRYLTSYRYSLLGAASATVLALAACGGISDPSKNDGEGTVATVTGALTGADVPAGAHVAVVWRVGYKGTFAVGNDAAVTNGAFTLNLTTPADSYFFDPNAESSDELDIGGGSTPPSATDLPPPPVTADAGAGPINTEEQTANELPALSGDRLRPLDTVSGTVSKPMSVAVAGFVVYVDTNGNGKLDLTGTYADSPDEIIGGNQELMLVYLRDGSTLAYEKLRDSSGILPSAGYNVVWSEEKRWLPFNAVDLELTPKQAKLPDTVCAYVGVDESTPASSSGTVDPYEMSTGNEPNANPPSPKVPDIQCAPDGRSYYTTSCPTAPARTGLCGYAADYDYDVACPSEVHTLEADAGAGAPPNWPCEVISAADAGAP